MRKHNGEMVQLGAMPVGQPWLPGLAPLLTVDAFFSINTSYRTAFVQTRVRKRWVPAVIEGQRVEVLKEIPVYERKNQATGLYHACYDAKSLRWLNACYVDLDCYGFHMDAEAAIAEVLRRQEQKRIPPATMFGRSGRGLWLFWLLIDDLNPSTGVKHVFGVNHTCDTPARASAKATRRFHHVQGELINRLRDLGADPIRRTAVSYTRVPGSQHSKSGHIVEYWAQGSDGHGFYYTLPQLLDILDLNDPCQDEHPILEDAHADKDVSRQEQGRRGWFARWRNLVRDLDNLIAMRGGGFDRRGGPHRLDS